MCAGAYVLAWQHMDDNMREVARAIMCRALAAIDASGTYCVLPVAAKEMWYRAAHNAQFFDDRDACLAERRGE
jgi:hypothetical protein